MTNAPSMDDQTRAIAAADAMWVGDHASRHLGLERISVGPGTATFQMVVKQHHLNGHAICHGGFIFTLADTTFAFACNSYNATTVAQNCSVHFMNPGGLGDVLTATAQEIQRQGRTGIYDIRVTNQTGTVIAEFRGTSRTIRGTLFEETSHD